MKYLKNIIFIILIIFSSYIIIQNLKHVNTYMEGMNVDVEVEILPKKESTILEQQTVSTGNSHWELLSTSTVDSISTNATTFNNRLKNLEPPFYLKRYVSGGGTKSHKSTIYKRLTPLGNTNLWHLLHHTWKHNESTNPFNRDANRFNRDFKLYSNINDAIANRSAWTFCNGYDTGIGFPRDCGINRPIGGQWQTKKGYFRDDRAARMMKGRTWKWYLYVDGTKTIDVPRFTNMNAYSGTLNEFRLYDDNDNLLSTTNFKDVEDVMDSKGRAVTSLKTHARIDGGTLVLRKDNKDWYDRTNVDSYSTIWKFPVDIPGETTINRYEIDIGDDEMNTQKHSVSLTGVTTDGSRTEQKSNYGPNDWSQYEYYVNPAKMTWTEHENEAKKWGGHLTSITSQEEYEHVKSLCMSLPRRGWGPYIGGYRISSGKGAGPNNWAWSDGSPWVYENWSRGEPNDCCRGEPYAHFFFHNYLWNDIHSWAKLAGIYKRHNVNNTFQFNLLNKLTLGIESNGMASEPSQNNIGGN